MTDEDTSVHDELVRGVLGAIADDKAQIVREQKTIPEHEAETCYPLCSRCTKERMTIEPTPSEICRGCDEYHEHDFMPDKRGHCQCDCCYTARIEINKMKKEVNQQ